jgi:uncharacterized protein (TIGR02270 family)
MPKRSVTPIIPRIISQHAEEAAFLWLLRDRAVGASRYTLPELVRLDDRVEANIDGLRIAGEPGWEIVVDELKHAGSGEVFLAAVLALESADNARFDLVMEKICAFPVSARGFISAFGWVSHDVAAARLGGLLRSVDPILRSAGISASVIHGLDPGFALRDGFGSDEPELRRRAFAAVGHLGRKDLIPAIAHGLRDGNPACRFWAAWSSAVLGDVTGAQTLRRMAEFEGPFREQAAAAAGRLLDHRAALGWHRELVLDPGGRRAAIAATGSIGDPALLPWLLEQTRDPGLARLAAYAVAMVTGLDIARDQLEAKPPEAAESDTPDSQDEAADPDEGLPWPDASALARSVALRELRPGQRHLRGVPISASSLPAVLREGSQGQRTAAALELLAMGHPVPIDIRSPGRLQRCLLADGGMSAEKTSRTHQAPHLSKTGHPRDVAGR